MESCRDSGNENSMLLRLLHEEIPSAYKMSLSEGSYSVLEMSTACVDKEF